MTADRPSQKRYCDVVMEGGVTSGVIYPGFVQALHTEGLELRCIGGTSAGAIAAAGAAAAQLGQLGLGAHEAPPADPRPGGDSGNLRLRQGFAGLNDLAGQIVDPAPRAPAGELRLRQLFSPVTSTEHLFRLADAFRPPKHLRARTRIGRVLSGAATAVVEGARSLKSLGRRPGPWLVLVVAAVLWVLAIALVIGGSFAVALGGAIVGLLALLATLAALLWALAHRSIEAIDRNGYGIVSGMPDRGARMRPLIEADDHGDYRIAEYFTRVFDELAGIERGDTEGHLTFGDLWGVFEGPLDAPAMNVTTSERQQRPAAPVPRSLRRAVSPEEERAGTALRDGWPADRLVNLELISTCMTLGRPFTFPLDQAADVPDGSEWGLDEGFYWRPEEFASLFPPSVVDQMVDASPPAESWASTQHGTIELYALPPAWRIPVVVPTRMSLSVPVFFSGVPLWKRQRATEDRYADHRFVRCWFADGGITSNLPIHFFDSPVPPWPTFAINLTEPDPVIGWVEEGPRYRLSSQVRLWRVFGATNIDRAAASPFGRLRTLILSGVVTTARKWSDTVQATKSPYNQRVIHVGLTPDEGGFNLNMDAPTIARLRQHGYDAGVALAREFADDGWAAHRLKRMEVTLTALAATGSEIEAGRGIVGVEDVLMRAPLADGVRGPAAAAGLRAVAARVADETLTPATPAAPRLPIPNPAQRQRVRF